jgi:hypothetical protein
MGKFRSKQSANLTLEYERDMSSVLKRHGFQPVMEEGDHILYRDQLGLEITVDKTGWTAFSEEGKESDFGSNSKDLDQYLGQHNLSLNDQDKKFLNDMHIKSSLLKKGYTMTNEGYGGNATSTCYKCKQPIEEGQMANWEGGMEAHAGGCPRPAQKPQLTPSQRIQNMPQRGKPKTPAQLGLTPKEPAVGYVASLLKKKAVGLQNQGQPDAVCPKCQQPIAEGQMVNYPQGRETHVQCPPAQGQQPQPGQQPGWQSRLNLPQGYKAPAPAKTPGMISPNVGKPVASIRHKKKFAGVPPKGFAFVVPLRAAGPVAFHLAKAGLEDFEVINYKEDDSAMFIFRNEPEHHVAEEIVREEFAQQIAAQKDNWKLWAPQSEDPTVLKSEHDLEQSHQMMSSDKTAYDPDDELAEEGRQDRELHEEAQGAEYGEALNRALTALDMLAKLGPSEDIKGCAAMSAGDLRQFAEDFAAGRARHFGADEDSETPCCCVLGHLAFTHKK